MAPGDLVVGEIDVEKIDIPLAVYNRAFQDFRGWKVVFIKVGNVYEVHPLELGRSDGRLTEVLSGLNVGDHYLVDSGYGGPPWCHACHGERRGGRRPSVRSRDGRETVIGTAMMLLGEAATRWRHWHTL